MAGTICSSRQMRDLASREFSLAAGQSDVGVVHLKDRGRAVPMYDRGRERDLGSVFDRVLLFGPCFVDQSSQKSLGSKLPDWTVCAVARKPCLRDVFHSTQKLPQCLELHPNAACQKPSLVRNPQNTGLQDCKINIKKYQEYITIL